MSQRQLPKMALIKTEFVGKELLLTTPEQRQLAIPLLPHSGDLLEVGIWNDRCSARGVGGEADRWFGDYLNRECRLVYQAEDDVRAVDPDYGRADDQAAFSDGFPFLIASEASLQSLNRSMQLELPMTRFRPNLVVAGCGEYEEDRWREIGIGDIEFRLPKPCSRCIIPTIDPDTGEIGKEPLQTLNRLRKWNKQVYFGQNALHNSSGELAVGAPVVVLRSGPRQPPL